MRSFMVIALFSLSCSVVDGSDRDQLEQSVAALPPTAGRTLRDWVGRKLVRDYLSSKGRTKMGDVECFSKTKDTTGAWEDGWKITSNADSLADITTSEIAACMELLDAGMIECVQRFVSHIQSEAQKYAHPGEEIECTGQLSVQYDPDRVAAEARGANEAKPGDMNRLGELLTVGQVVDGLIASPIPPPLPGFAVGGAFGVLLPALCGLGAGWGCPDDPRFPGGDQ